MHIDLIPTLIEQYRETFEGEVRPADASAPQAGRLIQGMTEQPRGLRMTVPNHGAGP
jgi:hypothetical protein